MRVENVSVQYAQKFNLGNYESVEISIFLHAKVDEDEPVEGAAQLLAEQAKESVHQAARDILASHCVECPSVQMYYKGKKIDIDKKSHASSDDEETPF